MGVSSRAAKDEDDDEEEEEKGEMPVVVVVVVFSEDGGDALWTNVWIIKIRATIRLAVEKTSSIKLTLAI